MNIYRKLVHLMGLQSPEKRDLSPVFETGFHGDLYLNRYIASVMPYAKAFIETGTNVGTTLAFVARTYPQIPRYSCEPDENAFQKAQNTLSDHAAENTFMYNMKSPEFLYQVFKDHSHLSQSNNFYWLDAHSYGFQWPLKDELLYLTAELESGMIMVDDCEVSGQPQFIYADYDGQVCNYDYIVNALSPGKTYTIIQPAYTEHTSEHHPLVGHIGIAYGEMIAKLPETPDYSYTPLSL
ncbi:MAG: hypothetical protein ACPG7F_18495 [Aggregatilineales bacterium]